MEPKNDRPEPMKPNGAPPLLPLEPARVAIEAMGLTGANLQAYLDGLGIFEGLKLYTKNGLNVGNARVEGSNGDGTWRIVDQAGQRHDLPEARIKELFFLHNALGQQEPLDALGKVNAELQEEAEKQIEAGHEVRGAIERRLPSIQAMANSPTGPDSISPTAPELEIDESEALQRIRKDCCFICGIYPRPLFQISCDLCNVRHPYTVEAMRERLAGINLLGNQGQAGGPEPEGQTDFRITKFLKSGPQGDLAVSGITAQSLTITARGLVFRNVAETGQDLHMPNYSGGVKIQAAEAEAPGFQPGDQLRED